MRTITFAIALSLVTAGSAVAQQPTCGDVLPDGVINVLDGLTCALGSVGAIQLTPSQELAADVDGSGNADIVDALLIAQSSAGLGQGLNCAPVHQVPSTWREVPLAAAQSPQPRCEHSAAYDSVRNRTLVFAGNYVGPGGVNGLVNDLWAFDVASETWTELFPTGGVNHGSNTWNLHEDISRNRMVGHSFVSGGVFLLDFSNGPDGEWQNIQATGTAPTNIWQAGCYHPAQDALIVYDNGMHALEFGAGTSGTWTQLSFNAVLPPAPFVFQSEMLYDPIVDRCLFTAAAPSGNGLGVWEIIPDVAAGTANVRLLTPVGSSGGLGAEHHASFDATNNRIVFTSRTSYAGVSVLDLAGGGDGTWTTTGNSPSNPGTRAHASITTDSTGRIVLQGGVGFGGANPTMIQDTWVLE